MNFFLIFDFLLAACVYTYEKYSILNRYYQWYNANVYKYIPITIPIVFTTFQCQDQCH